MGCVIHFFGDAANVAELERLCPTQPCNVFYKGRPRSTRPNSRLARTSGISVVASDADFDRIELQQIESLEFLKLHRAKLLAMRTVEGVETASIDYGISMRNVVVQGDSFEPELLGEIASLGMRMILSQYPPQGKTKKIKQYRRALRNAA